MRVVIDLSGKTYGRLTVIRSEGRLQGQIAYLCKCECGNEKLVRGDMLRQGRTSSCGCLHQNALGDRRRINYKIFGQSYTADQICEISRISKTTFYRYLKEGKTVEDIMAGSNKEVVNNCYDPKKVDSIVDIDEYIDYLNYSSNNESINCKSVIDIWY